MGGIPSVFKRLFPLVSFAGLILVSVELIMQLNLSSICGTEGCRVVADHARYGDITMLLPGIVVFSILTFLSGIDLFLHEKRFDSIINVVLIVSIIAEGFLVGYQAFRVYTPCMFCLSVFAVFIILGIVRITEGHKEVVSGFAGFVVIFSLFYLVLPAVNSCNGIGGNRLVLFYGKNCPHCETIKGLCKDYDQQVSELPAEEHSGFLRNMNIDEVPVLLVNGKTEKRILIGEVAISKYLLDTKYNKESGVWVSELFSSSAHAGTCEAGKLCGD